MSLEFFSVIDTRVFCIDLEWLGNLNSNLNDTRIHSIAAVHCATRKTFSVVVDPAVPLSRLRSYPTFKGCRRVTRSWLKRNNAVSLAQGFGMLVKFINKCGNECRPPGMPVITEEKGGFQAIIVAHGCFRADLPVLKSALRRCNISYPLYWRFFDSLLFFRRVLPPIRGDGSSGYTLSAVAAALEVKLSDSGRAHDALPDALVLHASLSKFPRVYGALYNWWQTPLTIIPGVGLQGQTVLIQRGNLLCVEDVLNYAQKVKGDASTTPEAKRRIGMAFMTLGLVRTAHLIAKWCVSGLEVFDEIS